MLPQEKMDGISRELFMPIMLMLDFGMFQYLVGVYYRRWSERRVQLLLLSSFIGFASHVYFHEDIGRVLDFNDISESCAQLVFLVQITIIGYAVRAKVKLQSIVWFTYVAEMFIVLNWLDMIACAVEAAGIRMTNEMHIFSNVLETVTLTFVPIFRFFYLSLSGGFRKVLQERKLEMFMYFVVATHEDVFAILAYATGISWEFAQGVYMRASISTCILLNFRTKAMNTSAKRVSTGNPVSANSTGRSLNPFAMKNISQKSVKSGRFSSCSIMKIGVQGSN